ncbi:MAG TPA: protein-L-isoaspartate(D-aspartate) O-methyltransferase [Candidatus Krumholzibacteria bacterium]|nr:protein-L-isoaspartate(D-aspartate) O-methyltransferase [Candidatus Krumholzibacteria bacterium]
MNDKLERMLAEQIERRGVRDPRVIEALRRVDRGRFVAPPDLADAYEDHPLPIGHGQTISQPYIVALMTESIGPRPNDRVLEIGTGSGYQTAVLSLLVREVYSIEAVEALADAARERLARLGYANAHVRTGNGYDGWPEMAPFDAIVVTAAPPKIPPALVDQLAAGGRMIIPVGSSYQELVLVEKKNGNVTKRVLSVVRFVPMVPEKKQGGRHR